MDGIVAERTPSATGSQRGEARSSRDSSPENGAPHARLVERIGGQRRRALAAAALALVLGVGVWLLIGQAASYSRLADAIRHARAWWLAASLAGALLGYVGYTLLYQAFARVASGPRPPLRLALRLAVAVLGVSVIATAAGRLGGEYWSLRRMRERPEQAWSRVLAINTGAWALLAMLAFLAALLTLGGLQEGVPRWLTLAWLLALPVCALPALYLSSPARRALAEDRGGHLRRMLAAALRGLALLRHVARRRAELARATAGGLLYWGGELLTVWAALRAFGVQLGFAPLVIGYATGCVSTMLPLPAGGAGGVDAAGTYALVLVGVPLGPALLATLVQRVCTYWLPLAVALLGARSLRRLPRDLAAVPRPAQRPGAEAPVRARVVDEGLAAVPRRQWDALLPAGSGPLEHGYLTAWERAELAGLRSRPVVAFAPGSDSLLAACPGYFYELDMMAVHVPVVGGVVRALRRLLPGLLRAWTYELGSPTPLGEPFLVADERHRRSAIDRLVAAAVSEGERMGAQLFLVQNFASATGPAAEALGRLGFASVPVPPTAVVALPYRSFEDYLGAMRSKYRHRAHEWFERSRHLTIERVWSFADLAEELARLWRLVYDRASEVKREVLTPSFFRMVSYLENTSVLLARRGDGSIASFGLLLSDGPFMSFMQCGFDARAGRTEGAYFRLLYEIVREAIEEGCGQLELGITTLGPKLDLGGVPVPLFAWVRHRNPVMQRALVALANGPMRPARVEPRRALKDGPPPVLELLRRRSVPGLQPSSDSLDRRRATVVQSATVSASRA